MGSSKPNEWREWYTREQIDDAVNVAINKLVEELTNEFITMTYPASRSRTKAWEAYQRWHERNKPRG